MDHSENSSACEFVNFLSYSQLIINPGKHFGSSTKGQTTSQLTGAQQSISSVVKSISHPVPFSSHLNTKVRPCVSLLVSLHSVRSLITTVDWSFYILIYFCSLQSNIYDRNFYFKKSQVCLVQFNVTQAPSMARLLEAVSSSDRRSIVRSNP